MTKEITEIYKFAPRNNIFSMIELKDLSIGYVQKKFTTVVLSGINATLREGELTCLIGQNGIGKSTLLRTLSAFQPRLGGEICIDGKSIDDYADRELARMIGVVLTSKPDVQNLTVSEMVGLGRSPYTGFWGTLSKNDEEIVREAMEQVGISSLSKRMIQTLSDGERQKVMIAKALAQQTNIIFLDEPTAFLDYPSKVEMMMLLHRLSRDTNKMIFLSTHDMELALQIADTLWLMTNKTMHIGSPRQLANEGHLSELLERKDIDFDKQTMQIKVKF